MRVIVIKESDIKVLMQNLEFKKLKLSSVQPLEEEIYRQFNYVIVSWLHEHGSSWPN